MQYRPVKDAIAQKLLPHGKSSSMAHALTISHKEMESFIVHTFPPEERFKPLCIEVNGRKHRRFVTVIAEDLRYLRIFDLDYKAEDEGYEEISINDDDIMAD
jgi:anaphase-promoting complex subunit 4